MNFRFLHAADLHLGSPFLGLAQKDEDVAARFAKASRSAFEDLVTKALEEDVSFVVIAGDVFDGEWKDASIALFLNRQLARLSNRGIPTFLLRGNHDAESLVTKSLTWPDNVFEFSTRRPETHRIEDLRVALHGRGFPHREVFENYAVELSGARSRLVQHRRPTYRLRPRRAMKTTRLAPPRTSRRAAMTIGRSATSTRSKSSRGTHGSSIPATCRAAASGNAAKGERCSSKSQTGLFRRCAAS